MRVLEISNTAIDLVTQDAPFQVGNDVVVVNTSSESRIVETSDSSGSGYTTVATLGAAGATGSMQKVNLNKRYVRTSSGDFLFALGN